MWNLKDRKLSSEALWYKVETTKKWWDSSNTAWELWENLFENDIKTIIEDIKNNPDDIDLIFNEKLKWKNIPTEYRQELANTLYEQYEMLTVLDNPNEFKGIDIEDCIYRAINEGIDCRLVFNNGEDWQPINYVKLLNLLLSIEWWSRNEEWALRELIYMVCNDDSENVEDKTCSTILDNIYNSEYYLTLPTMLGDRLSNKFETKFKPTNEFYRKLVKKICDNNKVMDLAKTINEFKWLKEDDYELVKSKLLEYYPHTFLQNLNKFPGNLLDDEEFLKKLEEKVLWQKTNAIWFIENCSMDIPYLDRIQKIDPKFIDKFTDKLIEWWDYFYLFEEWDYLTGKINYLDKIKKIVELNRNYSQKINGEPITIYDKIIWYVNGRLELIWITSENLANFLRSQWKDEYIQKYESVFREWESIETILSHYDNHTKIYNWFYIVEKNGLYGALFPDWKVLASCRYKEYSKAWDIIHGK